MSVVTLSSAVVPTTKTRLGEPVESEKFRMRRMRIRQLEQEQVLEDMVAVKMIQQLRDSSIFPANHVKTEFSDLDGMSWERSTGPTKTLLEQWRLNRTARPLPKSPSVSLPISRSNSGSELDKLTIVTSASFDGLPSPIDLTVLESLASPITPTPTAARTFSCVSQTPHATVTRNHRRSRSSTVHLLESRSSDDATIRPPIQYPTSPPDLALSPLHYLRAYGKAAPNTLALLRSTGMAPPVLRSKRIRVPASGQAILPLKAQREMTVRPGNMRRGKMGRDRSGSGSGSGSGPGFRRKILSQDMEVEEDSA
ncbi:hypothetical protein EIP91_000372 [Steccherinum ochraceum]|uniref:Uncharacterized protein n=1 Tax=Steccherinum ochraceum TaxID=92696 RepID=A0A4R0RK21_9APHY|nr:hypothetical protein EIP91_000372 [Steccherinum ochraceum]